jgi:hypothetical protein
MKGQLFPLQILTLKTIGSKLEASLAKTHPAL